MGEQSQISIAGKNYSIPIIVAYQELIQGSFQSYYSISINEYLKKLNTITSLSGNYNFFSGSLQVDFELSELRKRIHEYTKIIDLVEKWKLALPYSNIGNLANILKKDVKNDLYGGLDPFELFDKYGTHFLQEVIVGAKCEYTISTDQISYRKTENIETIAELSYKRFTNQISLKEELDYGTDINEFNRSSNIVVKVLGGSPEYGKYIQLSGNYEKWIESIQGNPIFCNFSDNSLAPIWDLCPDGARKEELKKAYQSYASNKSKPLPQYCISNLAVIGSSNSNIAPPYGYTKIDKDLNAGAGGEYIYICYKDDLDDQSYPNNPITDIDVIIANSLNDAKNKCPANYTLIEYDLNKGAGGKYVYVCYSKQTNNEPVRSINIMEGSSSDIPASYGYIKIDKDLNAEAGGKYIYLCYSRNF